MVKPCSVCSSPQRDSIEKCLTIGDSLRDIAQRFGVSKDALWRHKNEHLTLYSPAVAGNIPAIAKSDDLLAQLRDLITRTLAALDRAESGGDDRMFLLAVREARGNVELMMKAQIFLAQQEAQQAQQEQQRKHVIVNVSGYSDGEGGVVTDMDMRVRDVANFIEERRKDGKTLDLAAMTREDLESLIVAAHMPIEKESTTWRDQLRDRINRQAVRAEDLTDDQLARIVASGQDNPTTEKQPLTSEGGDTARQEPAPKQEEPAPAIKAVGEKPIVEEIAPPKAVDPNSEEGRRESFRREWAARLNTPPGQLIIGGRYDD